MNKLIVEDKDDKYQEKMFFVEDKDDKYQEKMFNKSYLIYYEYMINHELFHVVRSIILWILIFIYMPY